MTVIDLNARRPNPHLQGKARCMACQREWQAVAPVGTVWLECPSCHGTRGVFLHAFDVDEGVDYFVCNHCDASTFKVRRDALMCCGCGWLHDRDV